VEGDKVPEIGADVTNVLMQRNGVGNIKDLLGMIRG
jgi:hypothetical protein